MVSLASYHSSRVFVALADRIRLAFSLLGLLVQFFPIRWKIRKLSPVASFRTHWIEERWGAKTRLSFTDPFPISLSKLPDVRGTWQFQEIEAFCSGDDAVNHFFRASGTPISEKDRRKRTPLLLEANPMEFVLSINLASRGKVELSDGNHRLAIATMAGLETVNVKVVYRPLVINPAHYEEIKRRGVLRWFFLPFPRPPHGQS